MTFDTVICVAGTRVHANVGSAGLRSAGPRYAQTTPPVSTVGYEVISILSLNCSSAGSFIMSTQRPSASNFQP
jgi:hypothetical protein